MSESRSWACEPSPRSSRRSWLSLSLSQFANLLLLSLLPAAGANEARVVFICIYREAEGWNGVEAVQTNTLRRTIGHFIGTHVCTF